jgi:alpha-tubulin suppressor-like RCC1 family protein
MGAGGAQSVVVGVLATKTNSTCALFDTGKVKCWGNNQYGQLGLGDKIARGFGAGQMGDALPAVDLGTGARATALTSGKVHTCALLDTGKIKCWGGNTFGKLGLGDKSELGFGVQKNRGDEPGEMGDALPAVDLGTEAKATAIALMKCGACALLDTGKVKCWGLNDSGELGLGDKSNRGDEPGEMGDALPAVDLGAGARAVALSAAAFHACALLDTGKVKCWGRNVDGVIGQGDKNDRGDEPGEMGDNLLPVEVDSSKITLVSTGQRHSCALLETGKLKCWGGNDAGQLGLGDTVTRGDEPGEMGNALPAIDLGTGP